MTAISEDSRFLAGDAQMIHADNDREQLTDKQNRYFALMQYCITVAVKDVRTQPEELDEFSSRDKIHSAAVCHSMSSRLCFTLEKSKSAPVARRKMSSTSMHVVSKWLVASYDFDKNI